MYIYSLYIYIHTYIQTNIPTHINTYIHTYTHTHTRSNARQTTWVCLWCIDVCVATEQSLTASWWGSELTFQNFYEPLCYSYTLGGPQPKRMRLKHSWAGQFSSDLTFYFWEFLWILVFFCVCVCAAKQMLIIFHMGWLRLVGCCLRLVGSLKL